MNITSGHTDFQDDQVIVLLNSEKLHTTLPVDIVPEKGEGILGPPTLSWRSLYMQIMLAQGKDVFPSGVGTGKVLMFHKQIPSHVPVNNSKETIESQKSVGTSK